MQLLAYTPFWDPLPIWHFEYGWPLLLAPLCLAVAIVYKSIRCKGMSRVPIEGMQLFMTIVVGMVVAAGILAGLARVMSGG